jgi:hypothetical protein
MTSGMEWQQIFPQKEAICCKHPHLWPFEDYLLYHHSLLVQEYLII